MFSIYFYILGWVSLTAHVSYIYFFKICLFLAVPGLCCCVWAFLGAESGGCSPLRCTGFSPQRLLLLCGTDSRGTGFSSRGEGAWLLCSMWNLP